MIKIEAITLEEAYTQAATSLECSVTQLKIEVVQAPSKGIFGVFSKKAIIVAIKETTTEDEESLKKEEKVLSKPKKQKPKTFKQEKPKAKVKKQEQKLFKDTIMPESFVSTQEDEDYNDIDSEDYEDEIIQEKQTDNTSSPTKSTIDVAKIALEVNQDINKLFDKTCFAIDKIDVSVYNETTLLVEFKGDDAALLIGKEGYRYKALSYMIFNWINTKYQVQLRLEIAEFLKNQEESISRYLEGVRTSIQRDGKAQTKILDGVLVQIALKELRASYPSKYVAIRTTRDGLKYIIVNDYHNN